MTIIDFEDQSRATSGLFLNEVVEWQRMRVVVIFSFTELARRFDEAFFSIMNPLFPVQSRL